MMIRSILLCLVLIVTSTTASFAKSHKVLLLLWRGETAAEQGLRAEIERADIDVEFTVFNAGQDVGNLADYLREHSDHLSEYALIYTFGTTVSKMTKNALQGRVPQVFNIVSDPIRSGFIDSYQNDCRNIAGLAVSSTIIQQVDLIENFGLLGNVGVVFNPREENSRDDWAVAEQEILKRGGNAVYMRLNKDGPIAEQVARSFGEAGALTAIMLPSDSLIVSRADELIAELRALGAPVFAASPKLIRSGAVAGLASDYTERCTSAGVLALEIIANGSARNVDSVPMRPRLLVNEQALAQHNLDIPESITFPVEVSN